MPVASTADAMQLPTQRRRKVSGRGACALMQRYMQLKCRLRTLAQPKANLGVGTRAVPSQASFSACLHSFEGRRYTAEVVQVDSRVSVRQLDIPVVASDV